MAGISIPQLLIIALIVVVLFGTNKLRTLGSDLGAAIKGFKKALNDEPQAQNESHDADFQGNSLSAQAAKSEESQSQQNSKQNNKEQV